MLEKETPGSNANEQATDSEFYNDPNRHGPFYRNRAPDTFQVASATNWSTEDSDFRCVPDLRSRFGSETYTWLSAKPELDVVRGG